MTASVCQSLGSFLGKFYADERVLDLTPQSAELIPTRTGSDDFWVHIE
jgi:hypothetical protein